jgi:GxxExxY protein
MELNEITGKIVDAAVNVHIRLGPGLFEEVHKQCLLIELRKRDLDVKAEVFMPVVYDGHLIDMGYRLDLLVESEIIVELKSVGQIASIHKAQLLTYLRLAKKKLGLLINFNVPTLPKGIVRIAN